MNLTEQQIPHLKSGDTLQGVAARKKYDQVRIVSGIAPGTPTALAFPIKHRPLL